VKYFDVLTVRQKVPILTYMYESTISLGDIVLVPFRNKSVMGVIWENRKEKDTENNSKKYAIKSVKFKFLLPSISKNFRSFLEFFARYYIIDYASCCKMVLPISLNPMKEYKKINQIASVNIPELNEEQNLAYKEIVNTQKVSVLDGITGSGKTEVYFHVLNQYIKEGKQVLLMLPEIGLTKQLIERFIKIFGFRPYVWHSAVTPSKKSDTFVAIASGEAKVVIGTRSSLFLPYKNLGLIIVDEEHDGAYKQEENILYNARDAAVLRASFEKIKVILVSATISIETYLNIKNEKYHHCKLTKRYGVAKIPSVKIVNMKNTKKGNWISHELENAIRKDLENGLQSLLFLNRRGFAPLMLCTSCSFRFACNSCSAWLVVHKKTNALICHHCGHTETIPNNCPECLNDTILACGPGVDRIAEEVQNIFPKARVHVFTREKSSALSAIDEFIHGVEQGNIDIIVGTQIITKGYHFPKISTVGIIDADLGASNIDLKANERCFQLLQQVSGRAGRDKYEGTVYIQTYFPDNTILQILCNNLTKEFYESELTMRKDSFLPPFSRIIALIVTGENEITTMNFAKKIRNLAPKTDRVKILGPAPATMSKLKGSFRFRILFISDKTYNLQNYAVQLVNLFPSTNRENIRLEVDPYSFY